MGSRRPAPSRSGSLRQGQPGETPPPQLDGRPGGGALPFCSPAPSPHFPVTSYGAARPSPPRGAAPWCPQPYPPRARGLSPGPQARPPPPRSPWATVPTACPFLPLHKAETPENRVGIPRHRGLLLRDRAGPQPPPASASAALAVATNLPGRGRRRPCPLVGGRLRRGSTARRLRRHPFVFELTPACRDSASPPDRAAGPFNSRRSAYPAAPARPAPPAPIGCAPPTGGAAQVTHWLPPAAQPRRPLPALKLP